MKSVKDAIRLSKKKRDSFYVTVFMIESWLGCAMLEGAAEYAEKKNAKDRVMQKDQAWQGFNRNFGRAEDDEFGILEAP